MATQNISQIPAPRVPLVDVQTNTVSREWFMWFNNIYAITGTGTGITAVINGGTGLGTLPGNGQLLIGNGTGYTLGRLTAGTGITVTNGSGTISIASTGVGSVTATAPLVSSGGTTPNLSIPPASGSVNGYLTSTDWTTFNNKAGSGTAPVTKTADFTVASTDSWIINNKSGSTCTVTLPAAASYSGRQLTFKNMQAQTLVSASSNVVPLDSTSAGTAILLNVVGNWATMVSDGTNWIIMQAAANNCLLLE